MWAHVYLCKEVEIDGNQVMIHELHLVVIDGDEIRLWVRCGSGTYPFARLLKI